MQIDWYEIDCVPVIIWLSQPYMHSGELLSVDGNSLTRVYIFSRLKRYDSLVSTSVLATAIILNVAEVKLRKSNSSENKCNGRSISSNNYIYTN